MQFRLTEIFALIDCRMEAVLIMVRAMEDLRLAAANEEVPFVFSFQIVDSNLLKLNVYELV